uniref:Structural maintenance of chromosomes protein n=1 Tax=Meloidogyne floridensis TaxID=298350 RepID=A0A915P2S0_9BILA
MQGYLFTLELENFKSFKGKQTIGPFKNFSAIIGPNGSGKSNLMDAISFVLGETAKNLRVKKLADLVHGVNVQDAISVNCKVKMMFHQVDDEANEKTEKTFQRSLTEFRVDDQKVSVGEYHKELEKINIFIKARNFLVYQGAVEQIAMQGPREMTQLFEELSKSFELRDDYERLKQEMLAAETNAQVNLTRKKDIVLEMREAKQEQMDAKRFQNLKQDLLEKNRELYLAQLFFAEKHKRDTEEELENLKRQVKEKKKEKTAYDKVLKDKQEAAKQCYNARNKREAAVQEIERRMLGEKPKIAQMKQQLAHSEMRLASITKAHDNAVKAVNSLEQQIKAAEANKKEIEKQKSELEKKLAEKSKRQGINLNEADVKEYRRLKAEVEKRCAVIGTDLENKREEKKSAVDANEFNRRRLQQNQEKLDERQKVLETDRKNLEALNQTRVQQEKDLEEATKKLDEKKKLEEDYNKVCKEIADAHGDHSESERSRRQHEAVENLKRVFTDKVYGRLVDLCKPSNRKYNVAVTKILGKHMNSIVCDNSDTGKECISYLREQHYPPETFLPVAELRVEPFREHLRTLKEPPGVKLTFDVIAPNITSDSNLNSKIKKALQFVCGNSLVCEHSQHAKELAYGITRKGERYRSVALDGTQFQPNGVISGGSSDLKVRAKKWDENAIRKLKEKRSDLQEGLRQLHANSRRELDVEMARNQIRHLETRLRFTRTEIERFDRLVQQQVRDAESTGEPGEIRARINGRELIIAELEEEIKKLEKSKNKVQDEVFSDFCKRIKIKDIREYEQREMQIHDEHEKSISAFTHQIERLDYELEYLRGENRQANVLKEEERLNKVKAEKKKAEEDFKNIEEHYKELEDRLKKAKKEVESKREEAAKADKEVKDTKIQNAEMDRLHAIERSLVQKQQERNRRAEKRHSLLHQCKLSSIKIPLISGSLNQIMLNSDLSADDSQSTSLNHSQSLEAAEEIEIDYRDLRDSVKKLVSDTEINALLDELTKSAAETEEKLSKMVAPSSKLDQRIDKVKERENENLAKLDEGRKKAQSARRAFEKVKTERLKRFQDFFEPVATRIDEVYKALSQNESAQAYLGPANTEEPYLDGINYNCIAPGKRYRPMDNLSGGEKTVAALALLFAIHSSNPSPFFVLDEVDAALDNTNIAKVVQYIRDRSKKDIQLIVISLKEEMYNKADSLIGIYPKKTDPCIVSGVLTYDLENFDNMFEGEPRE